MAHNSTKQSGENRSAGKTNGMSINKIATRKLKCEFSENLLVVQGKRRAMPYHGKHRSKCRCFCCPVLVRGNIRSGILFETTCVRSLDRILTSFQEGEEMHKASALYKISKK